MSRITTDNQDGHGEAIQFEVNSRVALVHVRRPGDGHEGLGLVHMRLGETSVKLLIERARDIRDMLTDAIEAAVSDEMIVRFLTEQHLLSLDDIEGALGQFRVFRQTALKEDGEDTPK